MHENHCCLRIFTTFLFCWKHILADISRYIFYKIFDYSVWCPESFKVCLFSLTYISFKENNCDPPISVGKLSMKCKSELLKMLLTLEALSQVTPSREFIKGDRNHWRDYRLVKYYSLSVHVLNIKSFYTKTITDVSFHNKSTMRHWLSSKKQPVALRILGLREFFIVRLPSYSRTLMEDAFELV